MIDLFAIFERGGTILWSRSFAPLTGDPLALLVRSFLLEDRLSNSEVSFQSYTVRWLLDNKHGLVFAVVFQRALPPPYAKNLLSLVREHFIAHELPASSQPLDSSTDFKPFSLQFDRLLRIAEKKPSTIKDIKANSIPPDEQPSKKQCSQAETSPSLTDDQNKSETTTADSSVSSEETIRLNLEKFRSQRGGRSKKPTTSTRTKTQPVGNNSANSTVSRGKVMRPGKNTKEDISALDFSEGIPPEADTIADTEALKFREQYLEAPRNSEFDEILESSDEEEETKTSGGLVNYFKGLAGLRALTHDDLKPVMDHFRDDLVGKNVAKEIADKLIESVTQSLEGKAMESMTSVSTMVRKSLDEALTRILTPQQSTDILTDIAANKGKGRPYVITFCGVNGVGKSTSLAKTCYYLLNHGHKVLIAACDTFRAGAVEQLRTHVRCLGRGVELFDRGYGKDAAAVAADGIRRAKELGYDVVLVDTAGRMQDNEPLMRALSKLVEVNRPDRLFFVGEALVGNDAVDQLTKFNKALTDHQSAGNPQLIDGIVLTKFDTIDDKVGAAVSMVYTTGQPIVFIGIGQTYMDLRKMNTRSLVKALLK